MLTTGNLKVVWQYSTDVVPYFSIKRNKPTKLSQRESVTQTVTRGRDVTTCVVLKEDVVIASGQVVRGWNDKQCYETARKLSLKNALETVVLIADKEKSAVSKEERIAIWEAYRTSTKNPRWKVSK